MNGDGSGNELCFVLDDSVDAFPGGNPSNREVSPWYTIDWVGWRLLEWDLDLDSVGSGTGNGVLEGELRFNSFQLRHVPGSGALSGRVYFDQLQIATRVPVSVSSGEGVLPTNFALRQNYPNPFNPTTGIRYEVPGTRDQGPGVSDVNLVVYDILGREVATLVNERIPAGSYTVQFDASGLASGVYIYRLSSGSVSLVRKMLLTK
jgi:hypothetical protein